LQGGGGKREGKTRKWLKRKGLRRRKKYKKQRDRSIWEKKKSKKLWRGGHDEHEQCTPSLKGKAT